MCRVDNLLEALVACTGSDLHLSAGRPPIMRVQGVLAPVAGASVLTSADVLSMVKEVIPQENFNELLQSWDTDCAYAIPGLARFRVNCFHDMQGYGCVMRMIPDQIPTFEQLNLPESIRDLCLLSKGLVVVTGPTGSGKSTTLAAMIETINHMRNEHIITIEDPIEFVYTPDQCVINQREVHRDTKSFAHALRAALREDPDIVLVGEIRDLETMESAIETAETGHLVFATLHTNTAASTVERMIDKFPGERQNQIRSMLADTLKGVIAQTLCKKIGGGRIAAFEILMVNTPVAALIREGKTHMLPSIMQTGKQAGMLTFSDELTRMVQKGYITPRDAYIKAVNKDEIETKFKAVGIDCNLREEEAIKDRKLKHERAMKCLSELKAKVSMVPMDFKAQAELAWRLATSPFEDLRDEKAALKIAEKLVAQTKEKDPYFLSVLGVAHAACGNFRRAINATERAREGYAQQADKLALSAMSARLLLFEKKQPFRDE